MTITARYFLVVKDGNPVEQNDDAAAADVAKGRFAVSDGATESGFSRVWSRLLVNHFVQCADGDPDDWARWLPAAQQHWLDELKEVTIPWYGEQQFELGAFATFLGVVLAEDPGDSEGQPWQAVAVGDSCLFHTRGEETLGSFPLTASAQFNSTPRLIGSRTPAAVIVEKRAMSARGIARQNDRLWLMSDALARWCFVAIESGQPPWQEFAELFGPEASAEQFATWVNHARGHRGLHNDDVTLMAIDVGDRLSGERGA